MCHFFFSPFVYSHLLSSTYSLLCPRLLYPSLLLLCLLAAASSYRLILFNQKRGNGFPQQLSNFAVIYDQNETINSTHCSTVPLTKYIYLPEEYSLLYFPHLEAHFLQQKLQGIFIVFIYYMKTKSSTKDFLKNKIKIKCSKTRQYHALATTNMRQHDLNYCNSS